MSSFHSFLERDSNFDLFVLVLSVSVGPIWIDVNNSTFLVGALPEHCFLVDDGNSDSSVNETLLRWASTMAWAENFLNFTNGYYKVNSSEGDQSEYLVPFPPGYTSTMIAHWTTDVIVLDPVCSWQSATTTGPLNSTWVVTLDESNLSTTLKQKDFGVFLLSSNLFICLLDFSGGR